MESLQEWSSVMEEKIARFDNVAGRLNGAFLM